MIASVRENIPNAHLVQMSDEVTPALVDDVRRLPYDGSLMPFRLKHLAEFEGECLILDTDVAVMRDVSHVWEFDFDLAIVRRSAGVWFEGTDIGALYPYNTGVMFSRSQPFWRECHAYLSNRPKAWKWWGDQLAVAKTAPRYSVLDLPGEYNWTPESPEELSDAYCWHYKGQRKEWMVNKWELRTGLMQ